MRELWTSCTADSHPQVQSRCWRCSPQTGPSKKCWFLIHSLHFRILLLVLLMKSPFEVLEELKSERAHWVHDGKFILNNAIKAALIDVFRYATPSLYRSLLLKTNETRVDDEGNELKMLKRCTICDPFYTV